jgi:glyoxylase-like metal-dependent hydrolase (beta-lactamase superfamily II)
MPSRTVSSFKCALIVTFLCIADAPALRAQATPEPQLELKVVTSSAGSLYANYTLITGQREAVLVDAPFTRADAHRLVAEILETGKTLRTIYVTHDHPDHFFSMEVVTTAFPDAQVISEPAVVDDIWRSIPLKIKRWGPMLGANGPRYPTAPQAWPQDWFELEGHRIEILGPMQGDHQHSTALWIPSLRALIAGDLVFNQVHLWFGEATAAQRHAWHAVIDELASLDPVIVVAGHKRPGLPDDVSSLKFMRDYMEAFEDGVRQSQSSVELRQFIEERFPEAWDFVDDFILGNSAQVAMGETPPWQE